MHRRQSEEFELRADLVPAADLLRSVTVTGATLIRKENELGQVANGYEADLIAIDGNPLENIRLLADPDKFLKLIIKGGQIIKDETVH
jgi:imidazolonepropionase-like amidohydrolase